MTILLFFLLIFGLLVIYWAVGVEAKAYSINQHTIQLSKSVAKPIRILHLTDIHFSKRSRPALGKFFDKLSEVDCDLVFCTGDMIDDSTGIEPCLQNIKKLLDKGKKVYAVYGNHDYYEYRKLDLLIYNFTRTRFPVNRQQHGELHRGLLDLGVHVMANETKKISWDDQTFHVHGVDDPVTGHSDITQLKYSDKDSGEPHLLLTHSVDILTKLPEDVMDVSFSGHSHGGQIRFPLIGPIVTHTSLGKKFTMGIQKFNNTQCVISRGVGTSHFFPARFLCPPEAVVVEIRGA